mmetsp:Transcript_13619/g.38702  ORF Transcript_13619/g.38702 Transcript_13619/m.38702 type:complete len:216 (-) Transcript_13619:646-1293(-)
MIFTMSSSGLRRMAQPSSTKVVAMTMHISGLMYTWCCRTISSSSFMHSAGAGSRSYSCWNRRNPWNSSTTSRRKAALVSRLSPPSPSSSVACATRAPSRSTTPLNSWHRPRWSFWFSSAAMPTSSSTTCARGLLTVTPWRASCRRCSGPGSRSCTMMLPGCRSAWIRLSHKSIFSSAWRPISASSSRNGCVLSTYSCTLLPGSKLSTRTSGVTQG